MKKLISCASFRTHTLEHLPIEFFLCLDDAHHLASRKDEHKTGMILLLQQFDLHIQLILTTDGIGASLIVTSIYVMQTAHLVEYHTLTLHLLSINGEKLCRLSWRKTSIGSDKLLQLRLETFRVE